MILMKMKVSFPFIENVKVITFYYLLLLEIANNFKEKIKFRKYTLNFSNELFFSHILLNNLQKLKNIYFIMLYISK